VLPLIWSSAASRAPIARRRTMTADVAAATPKRRAPASALDEERSAKAPKRRGRPTKTAERIAAAAGAAAALALKAAASPDAAAMEVARLQRAAEGFRPGGWQGKLPCRETEQEDISAHLTKAVKQGGSVQVLYISGMPGTGKTASVMSTLKQLTSDESLPRIAPVHINAMRLGSPSAVFAEMYRQLPGSRSCPSAAAHGELTNYFENRKGSDPVVLLMIDEIDQLITRNQAVLYRVFAWLSLPRPRLVVVAISNTMDLPERLLPRVASRFGIVRVDFMPYRRDQIVQILHERLETHDAAGAFAPTALRLCAARVAAGSGDIRKALQLCCRSVEVRLASPGVQGPADVKHLDVAEKELLRASPAARAIGGLPVRTRRFLSALLLELRRREADVAPLQAVTLRYTRLLTATSLDTAMAATPTRPQAGTPTPCAATPSARAPPSPAPCMPAVLSMFGGGGHVDEEVSYMVAALVAVALIEQHEHAAATDLAASRLLTLGAGLDTDDLAVSLEGVEDHPGVLGLIQESRSWRRAD